jgi:hypothetical protein
MSRIVIAILSYHPHKYIDSINLLGLYRSHNVFRVRYGQTYKIDLGCLHPVERVISYDVGFNPSTQRHYRRLIYYLYIHSYTFRS